MLHAFGKKIWERQKENKTKNCQREVLQTRNWRIPEQSHQIIGVDASLMKIWDETRVQELLSQFRADVGKNI